MTSVEAKARRRYWSDVPTIRNTLFVGGLVVAAGGFVAKWGPLPAQVSANSQRIGEVERDVATLKRESAFDTCRWQDSTISQCIHHLRDP